MRRGIVLPSEASSRADREVALLPSKPPQDPAGRALDLVHGPGVAGRHEKVSVGGDADRVDVVRVPGILAVGRNRGIGFGEVYMPVGTPLEEHATAGDVHLLHYAVEVRPKWGAADPTQVGVLLRVAGEQ